MKIIHSGALPAEENMRLDTRLLENLKDQQQPILRFYEWASLSATIGHFIKPEDFLDLNALNQEGVTLARRPTGGGILFHPWDFTFSFLMPVTHPHFSLNTLENYAYVNNKIIEAIYQLSGLKAYLHTPCLCSNDPRFCMAHLTRYDVEWQGKKIAGAAQRKTKWGYLHQGSLSLHFPDFNFLDKVLLNKKLVTDMRAYAFSLHDAFQVNRKTLTKSLEEVFFTQT